MSDRSPIRHGEVLLLPVATPPEGVRHMVKTCIVGHSESGHHHVLESDALFAQIVSASADLYVDLDTATPLRHQKDHDQHRELTVPPGVWRVIRKTEFDVLAPPQIAYDPPITPQRVFDQQPAPQRRRPVRD
jgi:hypothetical protein